MVNENNKIQELKTFVEKDLMNEDVFSMKDLENFTQEKYEDLYKKHFVKNGEFQKEEYEDFVDSSQNSLEVDPVGYMPDVVMKIQMKRAIKTLRDMNCNDVISFEEIDGLDGNTTIILKSGENNVEFTPINTEYEPNYFDEGNFKPYFENLIEKENEKIGNIKLVENILEEKEEKTKER